MPTSVQINGVYPGMSKFLYTAVLYGNVPESSISSTAELGSYSKRLMHEHLARASMEEVVSSDLDAQTPESKARVTQLTEKVKWAYSETSGNPADGRWAVISDLLRLHSTRGGRHWIGVNSNVRAPEIPKHLSQIPQTSEEGQELEQRLKGTEDVKYKVQEWIATAEFEPLTPDVTVIQDQLSTNRLLSPLDPSRPQEKLNSIIATKSIGQTTLKAASRASDPLSGGSKFGFNVVKRPNTITRDKLRPKDSFPPPRHSPPPALQYSALPIIQDEERAPTADSITSGERPQSPIPILSGNGDVSDSNLQPPSFHLSQIQTSTPRPNLGEHPQEQDLLRSKTTHTNHQPRRLSSPKPHDPETSHFEDRDISTRKREGSQLLAEAPIAKKLRKVVDDFDQLSQNSPSQLDADIHVTPPRENLLCPTEPLASSTRNGLNTLQKRCSKVPRDLSASNDHNELEHQSLPSAARVESTESTTMLDMGSVLTRLHVPESHNAIQSSNIAFDEVWRPLGLDPEPSSNPALSSNILETKVSQASSTEKARLEDSPSSQLGFRSAVEMELHADADASIEKALIVQELQAHTPTPTSPKDDPFRFPSVGPGSLSPKVKAMTYNLYGLDDLDSSPAKSLSSLAASDSGSDEVDERIAESPSMSRRVPTIDAEFNPQFTSTQKNGLNYSLALNDPRPSDSQSWANEKLPSVSQLQAEVNNQVDEFDKFMEADLGYDLAPRQ